jgi:hypothetical protein
MDVAVDFEGTRPTARDLSDMRFITRAELLSAREALAEALSEGELTGEGSRPSSTCF